MRLRSYKFLLRRRGFTGATLSSHFPFFAHANVSQHNLFEVKIADRLHIDKEELWIASEFDFVWKQ